MTRENSSSRTIPLYLAVMAILFMAPYDLNAQPCGDCVGVWGVGHVFSSITLDGGVGGKACDNNGGCHFDWFWPGCEAHSECGGLDDAEELVLTVAMESGSSEALEVALEQLGREWETDPSGTSLLLFCGNNVTARYPLPTSMGGLREGVVANVLDHPMPPLLPHREMGKVGAANR